MDWTRGQTIGRGTSATVYIAKAKGSGQLFAVKSAELSKSEFLKREQRILSTLKTCPQIVAYRGCDITLENGTLLYNMFMEYATNGTVVDVIHKYNGGLVESMVRRMTRQILLGLHHLHSNGIVHCDIKGQNILVGDECVKIADLGCARALDDVSSSKWMVAGTPAFMAPEVARGEQQELPADVWALGCTVIEMVTGRAPWTDIKDPISALYRIGYSGEVPEIPSSMSKQGHDFLSRCLASDPNDRWSTSELLEHEFVKVWEETDFSNSDTPTGVLDRAIWDSSDELETSSDPTHYVNRNSPLERIRSLCSGQEAPTSFWSDDNWESSERWVTVRSNETKLSELEFNEDMNTPTEDNCDSENTNLVSEDDDGILFDEATNPNQIHIQMFNVVKHDISISISINSSTSSYGIRRSYVDDGNVLVICRQCRKEIVAIAGLDFQCKKLVLQERSTLFIFLSAHHLPVLDLDKFVNSHPLHHSIQAVLHAQYLWIGHQNLLLCLQPIYSTSKNPIY